MNSKVKGILTVTGLCVALGIGGFIINTDWQSQPESPKPDTEYTQIDHKDDTKTTAKENVYTIPSSASLAVDISNPDVLSDMGDGIVLATIDSIDGGNNYSEISGGYVFPYTYGRITILESYKGNFPIGESVEFYRLGGTISVDQYRAGLSEGELEKLSSLGDDNILDKSEWVKRTISGDVEIEEGKTYLMYINPENAYYGKPNTYAIVGQQGGLREVQNANNTRSASDLKVLNNFTNSWEALSSIIETE